MKKIFIACIFCTVSFLNYGGMSTTNIHNSLMANYLQFGGRSKQAYELYKSLLAAQAPVYAYKGYIHLLFDTANYPHIIQLIPQLDPVFKHDPAIQLIFAQVLEKVGKVAEADERYVRLNDQFKTNQEIAFNAANSYLRRKEPENALNVIDGLLNTSARKANNFIFHFMKAQIYLQLNKKDEALKAVQRSLDMHPRFDKGWLLFALLHEQEGELNDAIKGYTHFLNVTDSSNREIEQHLLQLVFKQKIGTNSIAGATSSQKACINSALQLFERKQYQKALDNLDECIKRSPKNKQSRLLKIEVLTAMNKHQEAAQLLAVWIDEEPTKNIWYKALHLLTRTNLDTHIAIALLQQIAKKHPHELLPTLYLADLHMRIPDNQAALKCHKRALSLTHDNRIKEKILYHMGLIHHEAGQFKQFEQVMKQAKAMKSSYAPLCNLIAYYLTMQSIDLDQAQHLITMALQDDAHNPHYLDTQAMLFLKQDHPMKAIALLEKIAQKVPNDYTILEHLALARHHVGLVEEAIRTLEAAQRYAKTAQDTLESNIVLSQWKTKKQSNIIASAS